MKKATEPSNDDFQLALEALFPKYIETNDCFKHQSIAYMLDGYKMLGGGYIVRYSSFLAKECKDLFCVTDKNAIDCMKYLAHEIKCIGINECTKERYEELCKGKLETKELAEKEKGSQPVPKGNEYPRADLSGLS